MQNPVLKEYYVRYLNDVRNLSPSSVKHYIDALNNISRYLVSKSLITESIYEIMDFEQLNTMRIFRHINFNLTYSSAGGTSDVQCWVEQLL